MKKEWHRKAMLVRGLDTGNIVDRRTQVPAEVKSECELRRQLKHHSVTAEFFGDPLPGYSALDRKSA